MKLPFKRISQRKKQDKNTGQKDARTKLRIGLIGPGLIWRKKHRAETERLQARVEIVAACSRTQDSLDAAGVPGARQYTKIEDLLNDGEVDTVLVLTPIEWNAPTTIAALKAGKHVFVEKPLGRSVEECRAVLNAEADSGKRVYVLEQAVYQPDLMKTQSLLTEKRIGDLILFERIDHFLMDAGSHDAGGFGKTQWRRQCDFPLGALFDAGIHGIAQLTRLFGVPEQIAATGRKWRQDFGDFDEVLMQFTYSTGLRGVFSHSAALPTIHFGFNIRGTKGVIRPDGNNVIVTDLTEQSRQVPVEQKENDMWRRILAAHETGEPALYTSVDAARDVAILETVARAIDSGAQEQVERIGD